MTLAMDCTPSGGPLLRSKIDHLDQITRLLNFARSPASQVACETATKTGMVMVFGEITTQAKVDYEAIVRKTCRDIGFTSEDVGLNADTCKV